MVPSCSISGKELPRISGKSKLAEAIRYATSRREAFERFLTDGRVEIDSNIVSGRSGLRQLFEECLFAGRWRRKDMGHALHPPAVREMNEIDPLAWLAQTLERIAEGWPSTRSRHSMPWNFKN